MTDEIPAERPDELDEHGLCAYCGSDRTAEIEDHKGWCDPAGAREEAARAAKRPVIDEALAARIPPLTPDEYALLEASILAEGCRDPLIVWPVDGRKILVDGHNRLDVCVQHDLDFEVREREFSDREAVEDWMDTNQLGRRNLTADARALLVGRRYNRAKRERFEATSVPHEQTPISVIPQSEGWEGVGVAPLAPEPAPPVRAHTADAIAVEHGIGRATVERAGAFAAAADKLGIGNEVVAGEIVATRAEVVAAARALPVSPAPEQIAAVVEPLKRKPHVTNNSGENEWYTPGEIIEAARATMGGIDTDPASCAHANETVRAGTYYSIDDDGLTKRWPGRVWMNPPYGRGVIGTFINAFCSRFEDAEFEQAIVLVNNGTETQWFQKMLNHAAAICLVAGRVKFYTAGGKHDGPLQGQIALYFGPDVEAFTLHFGPLGRVLRP